MSSIAYRVAGLFRGSSLPSGYNIIVAAGQSNMQSATPLLVGTDDQTQENFYVWGTSKGLGNFHTIFLGADPLPLPTGGANAGNTCFATQVARQYAIATGKKTLLVFVPVANTDLIGGIKQWKYTSTPANPPIYSGNSVVINSASNLYSNMIYEANQALTAALALESGSAVVGFLWAQGENDANQGITPAVYQAALSDVIDGTRSQITGAANAWWIINGMLPEAIYDEPLNHNGTYANFRRIARAQKKLSSTKSYVAYNLGAAGFSDRAGETQQLGAIHYRNRGAWLLMAPKAISALSTVKQKLNGASVAAPNAPTIRSIEATSGQSLRLLVDRDFSQGNTDLVIQTSPAGAGTWTNYYNQGNGTFAYSEMVIIGGLTASTAYDVRIADVNSIGQSGWSATATATTTSSVAGYDFESDTVGSPPDGITSMTGRLKVIAGGTSSQGTVYGKSITVNKTTSGAATFTNGSTLVTRATGVATVGTPVQFTTTGTLPAPLVPLAQYFVVTDITSTTGAISETAGGAPITFTTSGSGTHTMSTSAPANSFDGWLDKIPVSADRTLVFRLVKDNASNSGQLSVILRAQPDCPSGSSFGGQMVGYEFVIDYSSVKLQINKLDDNSTVNQIGGGGFFGQKVDQWYRFSCVGTTIKLEYGTDGTTWTTFASVTDSTYSFGGAQINIRQTGTPEQLYIDSLSWS